MGFLSRLLTRRPAKILVVEDDSDIRELLRDALSLGGYQVMIAADGLHGLACFKKEKFDLLILDCKMPRMGGSELLELIRALPQGRKQAVIMLSGERMLDPIYKAYEHGILEWITKPFTAGVLLQKVNAHLQAPKK